MKNNLDGAANRGEESARLAGVKAAGFRFALVTVAWIVGPGARRTVNVTGPSLTIQRTSVSNGPGTAFPRMSRIRGLGARRRLVTEAGQLMRFGRTSR